MAKEEYLRCIFFVSLRGFYNVVDRGQGTGDRGERTGDRGQGTEDRGELRGPIYYGNPT